MPRNRRWSKEELVLALDLYFKIGASYKAHPDVIDLSECLNRLSNANREADPNTFRNPNGVKMKLGNFARFDGNYSGAGLAHGGRLDRVVWDEFSDKRTELVSAAEDIKSSIFDRGIPPETAKEIRLHQQIQNMLKEIGEALGKRAELEFSQDNYRYDAIWMESPTIPRASNVFEVQDRGNVVDALAKLKHARDIWGSNIFFVITQDKDRRRAENLLRPFLSGTLHEIEPHLSILAFEEVEEVHRTVTTHKNLFNVWLSR